MVYAPEMDFQTTLSHWLSAHTIGRRERTQDFNREIAEIIKKFWHEPAILIGAIVPDDVFFFAERVSHYCASRWNAIVSAIRFITPHGKLLKRRPVKLLSFIPPGQSQFETLLAECDRSPRSKAGVVVRFLSLTGLRHAEARGIHKTDVLEHGLRVRSDISKNGLERWLPWFGGLRELCQRLLKEIKGDFLLPRQNPRRAIYSASKRAGVKMSPHKFRHYFTTKAIECGVDIPTVARWLGHKDGGALLSKTYFHLIDEHSRRMAEKVKIAA